MSHEECEIRPDVVAVSEQLKAQTGGSGGSMATLLFFGQILGAACSVVALLFLVARLRTRRGPGVSAHGYGVLITGCDSGFGHALARALDRKGFVVFAGCLQPEGGGAQSLARLCSSHLRILKLDVTSDRDVEQVKRTVLEQLPERGQTAVLNVLRQR